MVKKIFIVVFLCSFVSINSMHRAITLHSSMKFLNNSKAFYSYAKNLVILSKFNSDQNFIPAVIGRGIVDKNVPALWKQHHKKAIQHKVLIPIPLHLQDIEDHDWVVTDITSDTLDTYDSCAIIKFMNKKKKYFFMGGRAHSGSASVDIRQDVDNKKLEACVLFTKTPFFVFEVNHNKLFFKSKLRKEQCSIALKSFEHCSVKSLHARQKLIWASLSANGYDILTKTEKGDLFLLSIEHLLPDRQKLVAEIKNDFYKMFVQKSVIINKDWMKMAHNNSDLAQDLKGLYHYCFQANCSPWRYNRPYA